MQSETFENITRSSIHTGKLNIQNLYKFHQLQMNYRIKLRDGRRLTINEFEFERLENEKENAFVSMGNEKFRKREIEYIKNVEELVYSCSDELPDNTKCKAEEYKEEWRKWFMRELVMYKSLPEQKKEEYRKRKKYVSFQLDWLVSYPNSTIKEQNDAFRAFCKSEMQYSKYV